MTPAQQLLRIVPADGDIEVDAVVANQDVGFVEIGQEAEIKIQTFPFTRYGLIHGRVDRISQPGGVSYASRRLWLRLYFGRASHTGNVGRDVQDFETSLLFL